MRKPENSACSISAMLLMLVVSFGVLSIQANLHSQDRIISVPLELPIHTGIVTLFDIVPNYEDTYQYIFDQRNNTVKVELLASLIEEIIVEDPLPVMMVEREFSPDEVVCMAKNIYFEAKNQSTKGQIAVGLVTLNRLVSLNYPDTVCGVVYERKQFSWYSDGLSDRPRQLDAYMKAFLIASALLSSDTAITDFTNGSDHYHADYVAPEWRLAMVRTMQIETHIFYRSELYDNTIL